MAKLIIGTKEYTLLNSPPGNPHIVVNGQYLGLTATDPGSRPTVKINGYYLIDRRHPPGWSQTFNGSSTNPANNFKKLQIGPGKYKIQLSGAGGGRADGQYPYGGGENGRAIEMTINLIGTCWAIAGLGGGGVSGNADSAWVCGGGGGASYLIFCRQDNWPQSQSESYPIPMTGQSVNQLIFMCASGGAGGAVQFNSALLYGGPGGSLVRTGVNVDDTVGDNFKGGTGSVSTDNKGPGFHLGTGGIWVSNAHIPPRPSPSTIVYTDQYASGWSSWNWGGTPPTIVAATSISGGAAGVPANGNRLAAGTPGWIKFIAV